jgi:hypothetical protein
MLLAAMLVDAAHFSFENGEEIFDRLSSGIAPHPFFEGIVDGFVALNLPTEPHNHRS